MAIEHPPLQRDYLAAMEKMSKKINARYDDSEKPASRYIGEFCLKHQDETRNFMHRIYGHALAFEPNAEPEDGLYHTKAAINGMLFAYAMHHQLVNWHDWVEMRNALPYVNVALGQEIDEQDVWNEADAGLETLGDGARHDAAVWADLTYNKPEYHQSFVSGFGYMTCAGIDYVASKYPDFYAQYRFTNAERTGKSNE